eukprot:GHVU01106654.1.p1 GENE.GHVU01106654.1~~GHVU01106654.1.p1  ORF type:complete len:151 (-),score=12.42 GHVU01106654.1:1164-1616(-)
MQEQFSFMRPFHAHPNGSSMLTFEALESFRPFVIRMKQMNRSFTPLISVSDANESGTKYVETFSLSEDPTFHSIGTGAVWSDVPKALKCSDKSTILAITANGPRDFKDYFNGDFYGGTTVVSVVAADKSHTLGKCVQCRIQDGGAKYIES